MSDDEEPVSGNKPLRLPKKAAKVKNKAPAQLQITAEQLLREAKERELELIPLPPKTKITDPDELAEFQRKKRKEFEDGIRKNRMQIANWIKYGKWEESIGEIQRSRSVFERALDVDHRSITIWLQYAEMEMRSKQINHARNIFDRAVTILPRCMQFWLKYSYMEEVIENVPGARQIYERWMEWEPDEQAWQTYINFELRYKEVDRARAIYQRFLHVHGTNVNNWIKYARFEEKHGYMSTSAEWSILERTTSTKSSSYGLDHLPPDRTADIFKHYTVHEKKFGERAGIEDVIVSKRRTQYEKQIAENSFNYDAWFDYLRLLENEECPREEVEDLYERAIANIPPHEVYKACLDVIPHKKFTFAKIWIMFAHFEIRQMDLAAARKILGVSIGKCPKEKLFRAYIDLELQLREFDRCRKLYEKFLEYSSENSNTWIKFAELETLLGDVDRARAIFDIAVQQPALDMPEILWKAYIDFEINAEEYEKARDLYEALLQRTNHIKVWISLAEFELFIGNVDGARKVYERANRALESAEKEERLMLLEAWLEAEKKIGDINAIQKVEGMMPRRVKKRRQIQTEDGVDAGWEEYYDYIFPQDQAAKGSFKLLEAAARWKKQREQMAKEAQAVTDDRDKERGGGDESGDEQPDKETATLIWKVAAVVIPIPKARLVHLIQTVRRDEFSIIS
ncbi:HAT repeat protein [Cooperia oncophora]